LNAKIVLLVVGLLAGGLVGYVTRPEAAEIKIGPLSVEVQGDRPAGTRGGELTSGQTQHIALFAGIGALIGFGLGFATDRRRA
jgi:hypothetical protein